MLCKRKVVLENKKGVAEETKSQRLPEMKRITDGMYRSQELQGPKGAKK
jgi:hypothetical protein